MYVSPHRDVGLRPLQLRHQHSPYSPTTPGGCRLLGSAVAPRRAATAHAPATIDVVAFQPISLLWGSPNPMRACRLWCAATRGPSLANTGGSRGAAAHSQPSDILDRRQQNRAPGGTPFSAGGGMDNSTLVSMDWNDWMSSSSASDSADNLLFPSDGKSGATDASGAAAGAPHANGAAAGSRTGAGAASPGATGSVGPSVTVRIACHAVAASFDLRQLESRLKEAYGSTAVRKYPDVVHCQLARGGAGAPGSDAFFFDSGVVACWGMSQDAEAQLVQDVAVQAAVQPLPPRDRERDVFRCTFAADPTAVTAPAAPPAVPVSPPSAAVERAVSPTSRRYARRPAERMAGGGGGGAAAAGFPLPSPSSAPPPPPGPAPRELLPPAAGPYSLLSFPPQMVDDTVLLHVRHMGDTATLLAVSYGLAQSTKLSAMEQAVESLVSETRGLPEALAEHGEVHLSGKQIGRLIGKVFVLKRAVNLLGNVAETPEFFWYAPDHLQALYSSVTRYVELPGRVEQLNSRFDVLQEMLELLRAQEENRHGTRLELVVIWLIVVEVVLGVFELLDLFGVIGPGTGFGG